MSRASEWAAHRQEQPVFFTPGRARAAGVTELGDLWLFIRGCGPEDALALGHWLLATFGDPPPTSAVSEIADHLFVPTHAPNSCGAVLTMLPFTTCGRPRAEHSGQIPGGR